MTIIINADTTINDIHITLERNFPFLRFEFFPHLHTGNSGSFKGTAKLFAISSLKETTIFEIGEDKKIIELKNDISKIGLSFLLYRKSGNLWIKTSLTEDWSLKMQNAEGKLFSP